MNHSEINGDYKHFQGLGHWTNALPVEYRHLAKDKLNLNLENFIGLGYGMDILKIAIVTSRIST